MRRVTARARPLAAVLAIALALGAGRLAMPTPLPPAYASLRAALAALPAETAAKPVLNGYAFGGYLMFEGVKPYVDARADMFGDAFLARLRRYRARRAATRSPPRSPTSTSAGRCFRPSRAPWRRWTRCPAGGASTPIPALLPMCARSS